MEEWQDIKGFEGYYQVSNIDRVKSLPRRIKHKTGCKVVKGAFLKAQVRKAYYCVHLCKDRKTFPFSVHRLVALHFIPNPDNKPVINHIDNNPLNNHYTNLEWCTISENTIHAINYGALKMRGEDNWNCNTTAEIVLKIRAEYIPRVVTRKFLASKYNMSRYNIEKIVNRKAWKHI